MAEGLLRSNKTRDGIAAILADNLGYMEEDIWERQQQWAAEQQKFRDMEAALEQGGLRVLNKPNMLKQNYWTYMSARRWTEDGQTYTLPAGDYIYGDAARVTGPGPYMKSVRSAHGQDTDEITETLQTLSGDDIITEMDGESYTRPIAFTVTNPPEQGWGNADQLIFNHGWGSNGDQGLLDLEDGKEYTMCCWAKVTGGTKMRIRFGWGENLNGFAHSPSKEELGAMTYKWIEISNTVWERISWRFTYHASQTWQETYNRNIAEEGQDPIWEPFQVTYTENYQPRVSFGVCRKYAGTVLLCGFRLVKGRLWISETYDGLEDGINANASAIENLKDADGDIMANLAEAEEVTAKVNHEAGEVFVIGNQMYRATVAIAAGETIEVGTNCEKKTAEDFFASKEYVEDAAVNTILVNLGTVNLGNGAVRFYPPFAASRYRPTELVLSNTDGISAVKVRTGKTSAEYINLDATIKYTPGVMYNYNKDVTIKLEKLEKVFTYGADWTEEEVNGATVDFTY